MPVQSIDQQPQPVTPQQKNINLSPAEFSKLLERLENARGKNSPGHEQAPSVPTPPQETAPPEKIQVRRRINHAPVVRKPIVNQAPKTVAPVIISSPTASAQTMSVKNPGNIIDLGTIDKDNPTVSQLLKNTPQYRKDAWNIIFSAINKTKEYNRIPKGTVISINTRTNELIWKGAPPRNEPIPIPTDLTGENITKDGRIIIGEISKSTPTVSHLLKQNSFYSDYTWKIIFSDTNKNKPYTSLMTGTVVTIDPQTYELSFLKKKDLPPTNKISDAEASNFRKNASEFFKEDNDFSKRLSESVKRYIGTPYNKLDCYGLLVKAITSQGINYTKSGGIRDRMEKMAIEQGLPLNAYQNGEGLVETSGTKIYDKSYNSITDAASQADQVYSEIEPILQEGEILSFSTPTSGHTGIVARKNDQWTYVNSGLIDNQVDSGGSGRRVGEELLKGELENWFALADHKKESLKISIGLLDEEKLNKGNRLIAQNNM